MKDADRTVSIKVKIYLPLCHKQPAMKTHGEVEGKLHTFLTMPILRFDSSTTAKSATARSEYEGFRVSFDLIVKRKLYAPDSERTTAAQPIITSTKL